MERWSANNEVGPTFSKFVGFFCKLKKVLVTCVDCGGVKLTMLIGVDDFQEADGFVER